jgi:hypothetical protein
MTVDRPRITAGMAVLKLAPEPGFMTSPLTYPDQPRDDNLAEFFLRLIGASVKKAIHALLVRFFGLLP